MSHPSTSGNCVLVALLLPFGFSSCSGTPDVTIPAEVVATISLDRPSVTLAVREETALVPAFRDAVGKTLVGVTSSTWSSSDPSTVAVDQAGILKGIRFGGPVTITVSKGSATASSTVTVAPLYQYPLQAQRLGVDSAVSLAVRLTDFFGVTIGTENPSWTNSNPGVALLDATGVLTGVVPGLTNLTATYSGIPLTVSVEVGIPTLNDGKWTGTSPHHDVVTIEVVFGEVRSFDMPMSIGANSGCVAPYSSHEHVPVIDNRFSMNLPYASTAAGQFGGSSSMSLSLSKVNVSKDSFSGSCGGLLNAPTYLPTVIAMTR